MPDVVNRGCRIHYEVVGSGPPLLLLPGWAGLRGDWGPVLPELARTYSCIVVDQRGTGESGRPAAFWSMETMASDARAVLDDLGIERTHVLGNSLGGIVAQEVAHRYPDHVASLILLETSPGIISRPPALLKLALKTVRNLFARAARRLGMNRLSQRLHLRRTVPVPPQRLHQLLAVATYAGFFELRNVKAPALIIHGTEDLLIPFTNAQLMERWIANATLTKLDGATHDIISEFPERVIREISNFLAVQTQPRSLLRPTLTPAQLLGRASRLAGRTRGAIHAASPQASAATAKTPASPGRSPAPVAAEAATAAPPSPGPSAIPSRPVTIRAATASPSAPATPPSITATKVVE